jgi:glycosyltransferase involved in cell wall biosynthesis
MAVYTTPDERALLPEVARADIREQEREAAVERVSIVVPAYNEEERIDGSLSDLVDWIGPGRDVEVIVVDDGSTDATVPIARERLSRLPSATVVEEPHRGKGAAVRRGVAAASRDNVLFMDADLATELDAIPVAVDLLEDHHVVVGSRRLQPEWVQGMTVPRRFMNVAFHSLVRSVTGVAVTDSQCGFKAFRTDVARYLFPQVQTDGFAFDVEVLALASDLGYAISEQPVHWSAKTGGTVRPVRDAVTMTADLLRIGRRLRRRRARRALEMDP